MKVYIVIGVTENGNYGSDYEEVICVCATKESAAWAASSAKEPGRSSYISCHIDEHEVMP